MHIILPEQSIVLKSAERLQRVRLCVRIYNHSRETLFPCSLNAVNQRELRVIPERRLFYIMISFGITVFLSVKDKSRVAIIVDYSRDYTVVNGV